MVDTKNRFNPSEAGVDRMANRFAAFAISGRCHNGRHFGSSLRRLRCGKQNCNNAYKDTADNADDADAKERNIGKFFAYKKAQRRTQRP